jgi:hypothetical protein
MRTSFLIVLLVVGLAFGSAALANVEVQRWGGSGYDPASRGKNYSSLFSAHPDLFAPGGKAHFQIWVDSVKTFKGVRSMIIRQEGHNDIFSSYCYKAQKHITAPYACSFNKADFLSRSGMAVLVVIDREGRELLRNPIDIMRIKQVF